MRCRLIQSDKYNTEESLVLSDEGTSTNQPGLSKQRFTFASSPVCLEDGEDLNLGQLEISAP